MSWVKFPWSICASEDCLQKTTHPHASTLASDHWDQPQWISAAIFFKSTQSFTRGQYQVWCGQPGSNSPAITSSDKANLRSCWEVSLWDGDRHSYTMCQAGTQGPGLRLDGAWDYGQRMGVGPKWGCSRPLKLINALRTLSDLGVYIYHLKPLLFEKSSLLTELTHRQKDWMWIMLKYHGCPCYW